MGGGYFKKKRVHFSQVSNIALRDSKLSLKAKGLYSLIQSYITLQDFILYKGYLMAQCKEKETAFDSAWRELKKNGYLIQNKHKDIKTGKWIYEYELLDEPYLENPPVDIPPVDNPDAENIGDKNNTGSNNTDLNNILKNKTSSSNNEEEVLLKELYKKCKDNNVNISKEELCNLLDSYDKMKVIRMLNKVISSGSVIYNPHNYIATSLDKHFTQRKTSDASSDIENKNTHINGYSIDDLEQRLLGWK